MYPSGLDNLELHRVAKSMNSQSHSALIPREPVSPRFAPERLRTTLFDATVTTIYAFTPQAEPNIKDAFNTQLQHLVSRILRREVNCRFS